MILLLILKGRCFGLGFGFGLGLGLGLVGFGFVFWFGLGLFFSFSNSLLLSYTSRNDPFINLGSFGLDLDWNDPFFKGRSFVLGFGFVFGLFWVGFRFGFVFFRFLTPYSSLKLPEMILLSI